MVRIQGGEESSALVMPRGDELGWRLEGSSREDWLRGGSRGEIISQTTKSI